MTPAVFLCLAFAAPRAGARTPSAEAPRRFYQMGDAQEVEDALRADLGGRRLPLRVRLAKVSERFLGTPYRLGPLGEGPRGEFDRGPLLNLRAVDCTTFVEQTLAFALEGDFARGVETLARIRYKGGAVGYETRNHFPAADWIPNNVLAGFLRDITPEVAGAAAKRASKVVRKADWFGKKTAGDLRGFEGASAAEQEEKVRKWRGLGALFPDRPASVDYLPLELLPRYLPRIPSGTIVNLVREAAGGPAPGVLARSRTRGFGGPHRETRGGGRREPMTAASKGKSGRAADILKGLRKLYPAATCELRFKNPLQLLVATILSAQCTDKRVNLVTPELFKKYPTAEAFAAADAAELEAMVRSTGFFRSKARSILEACRRIAEDFGGRVPKTMEELLTLRGVARKTANVVLGTAYGVAAGVVVDTHVIRLARRMGLSEEKDPVKIERDLTALVPRASWIFFGHAMTWHGRRVCFAADPDCPDCALNKVCPKRGL